MNVTINAEGTVRRVLMYGFVLSCILMITTACSNREQFAPQPSPDGRWVLTPSLHQGNLVRLTVRERSTGRALDEVNTRDTDAMKWVCGWVDNTSYLFWGADTGASWVRHVDAASVTESPLEGRACTRLEELFEGKYGERRTHCLKQ